MTDNSSHATETDRHKDRKRERNRPKIKIKWLWLEEELQKHLFTNSLPLLTEIASWGIVCVIYSIHSSERRRISCSGKTWGKHLFKVRWTKEPNLPPLISFWPEILWKKVGKGDVEILLIYFYLFCIFICFLSIYSFRSVHCVATCSSIHLSVYLSIYLYIYACFSLIYQSIYSFTLRSDLFYCKRKWDYFYFIDASVFSFFLPLIFNPSFLYKHRISKKTNEKQKWEGIKRQESNVVKERKGQEMTYK